jgi:hypothetical protein
MSSFSPTDAALEGIRLSRERPRALLVWAGFFFAFLLILRTMADLTLDDEARRLLQNASTANPDDFDLLLRKTWRFLAIGYPILIGSMIMFFASLYRTVLDGPMGPRMKLRLGADELRLFLVAVIKTAVTMALVFFVLFTFELSGIGSGQVVEMVGRLVLLALLVIAALVWIRLSLAGPATCAEGRVLVFQTWPLTGGQFWRLVGAYLMAAALGLVVLFAMLVVVGPLFRLVLMVTGVSLRELSQPPATIKAFAMLLLEQAISSFVLVSVLVILVAPGAEAYRQLTRRA